MTPLEKDIETLKPQLVGKILTNIYHTKLSERYEMLPGVSYVLYFRTIVEFDNDQQYDLWKSYLSKWNSDEEIIPVTNEHWDVADSKLYLGQKLKDIIQYNGQIFLVLENDIAIEHTIDFGDGLKINSYSKLIYDMTH